MNKETFKKISLILAVAFLLTAGQAWAEPPTEDENNGAEVIKARRDADKEQIEAEAEELDRLQEEDRKACEAEEKGEYEIMQPGGKGQGGGGQNDPHSPNNPDSPYHDEDWDPEGDDDGDGIPNNQDDDADGDGVRDVDDDPPPGEVTPICDNEGRMAAYVAANEGWRNERYLDTKGNWTIGIGHLITGNEPSDIKKAIQETGQISDEQVKRLFAVDLQTHKNIAIRIAGEYDITWGSLSEGRQIVLADMAFTLGYPKFVKFADTWGAIARAQREDTEANWGEAAREILDSNYARDVKGRANRNSNIMGTWHEKKDEEEKAQIEIIDTKIQESAKARTMCDGNYNAQLNPLKYLAYLFQTPIALAQELYVPVIEQDGQLRRDTSEIRSDTQKIKEYTDDTRILSIQICTHLRAIRRIQSRFEQKMVEDATVMKIKSTEIEKYRQAMFGSNGLVKTGGARIDENGNEVTDQPLYIVDNELSWKIAENEGFKRAIKKIESSNNQSKDLILENIDGRSDNYLSLNSNISEAEIKEMYGIKEDGEGAPIARTNKIPIISSIFKKTNKIILLVTGKRAFADNTTESGDILKGTSNSYLSIFVKFAQPRNNPMGSYMIAVDETEVYKNNAILAARDQALQSQGFLPIKECIEKSSDEKTCLTWHIIQPGIILKETQTSVINSPLRQLEAADEMGEIGGIPDITEITTNKPVSGSGGAVGPGMTAPDSIPDSASSMESDAEVNPGDGEWGEPTSRREEDVESDQNWSDLSDFFDFQFGNSDSDEDVDLSNITDLIDALLAQFGRILDLIRPVMIFKYDQKDDGKQLIYWYSLNAYNCYADNDWLSSDIAEGGVAVGKGEKLNSKLKTNGLIGSLKVKSPAEGTKYKIRCENRNGNRSKSIVI